MSGFDSPSVLTALQTMLQAVGGMQQVAIGAPESLSKRVSAYVAVGGNTGPIDDRVGGLLRDEQVYFVGFGYRVADAEATAETTLAAFKDAFVRAFYANRRLSGAFTKGGRLDFSLTRDPRYEVRAGQEFRVLPILVIGSQEETYDNQQ